MISAAPCTSSITYNEFGISTCAAPPKIYLTDTNEKQVYADGLIFTANELHSDVSLVIPSEEYKLKIHIDNADHKKTLFLYYIVKVSEYESGYTSEIKWKEITIDPMMPSQEFEIPLQFEEGIYSIEVFLWSNLDNPKVMIAKSHIANPIVKSITVDTKDTRYVGAPDEILLNSTQKFVYKDNGIDDVVISEAILEPEGRRGSNFGGFEFKDEFTLVVSSERAVYGDIVYFDPMKQEWIIVEQALSREFKIVVQIPKEQSIFNFKWGTFVLNPNADPVRVNMTEIITNNF